jgi:hypothetical protein
VQSAVVLLHPSDADFPPEKQLKSITRATICLSAAVGLVVGFAAPASAAPPAPPEAEVAQMADFWAEHGVPLKVRERLIQRVKSGEVPDSMDGSSAPVSATVDHVGVVQQTTETFADGSVRVLEVQDQPGVITDPADPAPVAAEADTGGATTFASTGVSSCKITSGSGYSNYSNCLVKASDGSIGIWFYASWTLVQGAANDKLTWTGNPGQNCGWPYYCAAPWRSTYKSAESSSSRAGATYTTTYQHSLGTGTIYLSLTVGANTYYPTFTKV